MDKPTQEEISRVMSALGSIRTAKKAAASRANGRKRKKAAPVALPKSSAVPLLISTPQKGEQK